MRYDGGLEQEPRFREQRVVAEERCDVRAWCRVLLDARTPAGHGRASAEAEVELLQLIAARVQVSACRRNVILVNRRRQIALHRIVLSAHRQRAQVVLRRLLAERQGLVLQGRALVRCCFFCLRSADGRVGS